MWHRVQQYSHFQALIEHCVLDFSVQLFTIPSIASEFVVKHRMMDVLLGAASQAIVSNEPTQTHVRCECVWMCWVPSSLFVQNCLKDLDFTLSNPGMGNTVFLHQPGII